MRRYKEHVEDYLMAIYKYQLVYGHAKTSQIAKELGVKDATVTKVLKRLQDLGLVTVSRYHGARLTEKGREIASKVLRRHRIIEIFLHQFLGFDVYKAHEYAHLMEHLPDEIIEAIYRKLGKPDTCVLGIPIDSEKVEGAYTLDRAEPGKCYQIVCLMSEFKPVISKLQSVGCWVCSKFMVESKGSKGLVLRTEGGGKLILSLDESKSVAVKEVDCSELADTAVSSAARVEGKDNKD
jgi:DtxR family Mn-dependent transcriptional regulator